MWTRVQLPSRENRVRLKTGLCLRSTGELFSLVCLELTSPGKGCACTSSQGRVCRGIAFYETSAPAP